MRILAIKLADLGDLLLSEPALRSLRLAFPEARIDVLTTPHAAELLPYLEPDCNPIVFSKAEFDSIGASAIRSSLDAVRLAGRLHDGRYDRVAIFHHLTTAWGAAKFRALAAATAGASVVAGLDNGRGKFLSRRVRDYGFGHKHESEYMLEIAKAAGGAKTEAVPRFRMDPSEDLPFDLPSEYIVLAPQAGSYSRARVWPLDRYRNLGKMLTDDGWPLVIVGGDDAREAAETISSACSPGSVADLAGRTNINQTALVLEQARAVIGNDSFPVHLASAVGAPTIAIFGPSNVEAWGPRSADSRVLTAGLPCSPCLYTGYHLGRPEGCPARTCLTQITASSVYETTLELLDA